MLSRFRIVCLLGVLAMLGAFPAFGADRSRLIRERDDRPSWLQRTRRVPRVRGVRQGEPRDMSQERGRQDDDDEFGRDHRFGKPHEKRHHLHPHFFRFPWTRNFFISYPDRSYRFDRRDYVHYRRPYTTYVLPPYGYRSSQAYRRYVTLETPTARRERAERERRAEQEREFASDLSSMIGGPERVGAAFALGETRLAAGEFDEALAAFQQALRRDDGAVARMGAGLALLGMERYEGAAYMLRRAVRQVADREAFRPDLRAAFGGDEEYRAVAERLEAAVGEEPDDRGLRFLLGFHYFGVGRHARAAKVLYELHQQDPTDRAAAALLAAAESRLGPPAGENSREQGADDK